MSKQFNRNLVPLGGHACQEDSHALSLFYKVSCSEIMEFVLGHRIP